MGSEEKNKGLILVVEDEVIYAKLLRDRLGKTGFDVVMAGNGEEAIKKIKREKLDLVVLDLLLPIKDGYAVLEEMRADKKLRKIKVIVLSNLGQKVEIERAKKLGALEFVIKTDVSLKEMIGKIKRLVE